MRDLDGRHRARVCWLLAIGVVGVASGVGCARVSTAPTPSPSPNASVVPWLALPPGHQNVEYRLSPCPDYVEFVGAKEAWAEHQLNCAPVGTIAPGGSVTLAMRIEIPATMTVGPSKITWVLRDGRIRQPVAYGAVQIV